MSEAVHVHQAYKQFGTLSMPRLKWNPRFNNLHNKVLPEDYHPVVAIDRVSFDVHPGEIFGILGSHGSGKSTLIRMLAGLLPPDSGELRIFDLDVVRQPALVQQLTNRIFGEASLFRGLSPVENLVHNAHLSGLNNAEIHDRTIDILLRLGLDYQEIHTSLENLTRLQQQKVSLARALLDCPRLLLLDEPTLSLDPESQMQVHALIRALRDEYGMTVLIATQDQDEAANLCERIAILEQGKFVAIHTPWTLNHLAVSGQYFQTVAHQTPTN